MTAYYLELALQNLRRNPWLTALVVLTVGVGIGSSVSVYSVLHAMSRDPAPERSSRLHAPRIDSYGADTWALTGWAETGYRPPLPDMLAWRDMMALRTLNRSTPQTAMLHLAMSVADARGENVLPKVGVLGVDADFFDMFGLSFASNGPWSRKDEEARARVAVISARLARRYRGEDGEVKEIALGGTSFRVAGIVEDWNPRPRFYLPRPANTATQLIAFDARHEVFIPMETYLDIYRALPDVVDAPNPPPSLFVECPPHLMSVSRAGWFRAECPWTQLWVDLPTPDARAEYTAMLRAYAEEQWRTGRFNREPATALESVRDRIGRNWFVPQEYRLAPLVAFGFLMVCLINATGLMLARFNRRYRELALRRALGASRRSLMAQCLVEATLIGVAGAALGLLLLAAGISFNRAMLPVQLADFARVDARLIAATVLLAVAGTLLAGWFPAWRASRAPAYRASVVLPRRWPGNLLVAAQVVLTLAIAANALHAAWQRSEAMRGSPGVDGRDLFILLSQWSFEPDDLRSRRERDLAALRELPGVVAVSQSLGPPGGGVSVGPFPVYLESPHITSNPATDAVVFMVDHAALGTFRMELGEGRWFRESEIGSDGSPALPVVVSRALAASIYPGRNPLQQRLFLSPGRPFIIVGVIEGLQGPVAPGNDRVIFTPQQVSGFFEGGFTSYVVRTLPGQRDAVMRLAERRLVEIDPTRALPRGQAPPGDGQGAISYEEMRAEALVPFRKLAMSLVLTCALLLLAMALGIVGLTSYWAAQERQQLGVRRALGATRGDILGRLLAGNLATVAGAAVVGSGAAVAVGVWLARWFAISPVPPLLIAVGALLVILISQVAAFWPALRAARRPPALVARET